MIRSMVCTALCVAVIARGELALQAPTPETSQPSGGAIFHSGTRLVEVEVVVRGPQVVAPGVGSFFSAAFAGGPPFGPPGPIVPGLTKDDFTILDNGKPQSISVFRAGLLSFGTPNPGGPIGDAPGLRLPPGAVSNRIDVGGQPLNGGTAVLIDQLNTKFDLKAYERLGAIKLLRSLTKTDRIALYSLGANLHLLQDFTSDPQKLIDAVSKVDPGLDLIPTNLTDVLQGFPEGSEPTDCYKSIVCRQGEVNADVNNQTSVEAMKLIVQNLSRVPGRKNLVWLMDEPQVPPAVMAMLQGANIALYPVLVRAVGESGVLSKDFVKGQLGPFTELKREHEAQALAAATGGKAFFDSMDLPFALRAAEEDQRSAYVLGFYPSEEALDGRYHAITVEFKDQKRNKALEFSYRPGYLATKLPTNVELLQNPLESTSVGLTAQIRPDPASPERQQIHLTVDIHDIRLEPKDGAFAGAFDFVLMTPASGSARSQVVQVNFPEAQLAQVLASGYSVNVSGLPPQSEEIRLVVRDRATGAVGSLRIPAGR